MLAAKAGLKQQHPLVLAQAQAVTDGLCRQFALSLVGITVIDIALWNAVKGINQLLRRAIGRPRLFNTGRHGADVGRLLIVLVDKMQRRRPAPGLQLVGDGIKHRTRGGAGILRIQRQHDQTGHALVPQSAQGAGDGRVTVAHGQLHLGRFAQLILQGCRLRHRYGLQRRTCFRPDFFIRPGAARRANIQNDTIQRQIPQPARRFHHPRVGQEFFQVLA